MSYGRKPFYIYSDGENLHFDFVAIPNDKVNAFLYKVLMVNRRAELAKRLQQGKKIWVEGNTDDPHYMEWVKRNEDFILRKLMKG